MKNNFAKVSVIVPVYNVAEFLPECIESIKKQTYENLEIILVDDGSTDSSGDICDEYAMSDKRIMVYHQQNQGVVTARNIGIENASGEFIAFVDSDDTIAPNFIEFFINNIGDCDFISAGFEDELKNGNKRIRYDKFAEGIYKGEAYKNIMLDMLRYDKVTQLNDMVLYIFNKMYRTEHVKQFYKKVPTDLSYAEDVVFCCANLLQCKSMVISHECLYHYRYRVTSAVHQLQRRRLIDLNKVYLALYDIFDGCEYRDRLLLQLERWIVIRTYRAIKYSLGFSKRGRFRDFEIDLNEFENKKIVLYGAGKIGNDYYRQLSNAGIEIVCWVDKKYQELKKLGLDVCGIDEMKRKEFDLILIAVGKREMAKEIAEELEREQIAKEKMQWRKPRRIYY